MRSAPLVVVRWPKRPQPSHDISDSRFPHLRILSILCYRGVALDRRDQKAGSLVWIHVAANCSSGLPLPQKRCNTFLPVQEYPFQSLAELLVQRRHLLCQKEQRTTGANVLGPSWYPPDNADQDVDSFPLAPHRTQPPVARKFCDFLFDNGIAQGLLALEVVVERSLGDVGGGENCIDARTLKA